MRETKSAACYFVVVMNCLRRQVIRLSARGAKTAHNRSSTALQKGKTGECLNGHPERGNSHDDTAVCGVPGLR